MMMSYASWFKAKTRFGVGCEKVQSLEGILAVSEDGAYMLRDRSPRATTLPAPARAKPNLWLPHPY